MASTPVIRVQIERPDARRHQPLFMDWVPIEQADDDLVLTDQHGDGGRLGEPAAPDLQMVGDRQLGQQILPEHMTIGSQPAGPLHHCHGGGIGGAGQTQAYALHLGSSPAARAC